MFSGKDPRRARSGGGICHRRRGSGFRPTQATDDSVLKGCRENGLLEDLTLVNEYTSHFHHGGNDGVAGNPNARELLTYAERALSIIRR